MGQSSKILVVDDEEDITTLISYNLGKEGFAVTALHSGEKVIETIKRERPALVVLDLMLPSVNGLDICRELKKERELGDTPVVMLTAKGEEADIVAGLELGADDYVTKPFSPRILSARIRAVLRRKAAKPTDEHAHLGIHDLRIDPLRHEVVLGENRLTLSATEFRILHYLARRPGNVYTRSQIVTAVHGDDYPVTDRSIDVQIVGLRKKLGVGGDYIETVRGVGYRFRDNLSDTSWSIN